MVQGKPFADFLRLSANHLDLFGFVEGQELGKLQSATRIEADIDDWTVTDLYGSNRDFAGSFANNSGVLISDTLFHGNSARVNTRIAGDKYTPELLERLYELNRKRTEEQVGTVTIEELGTAPSTAPDID